MKHRQSAILHPSKLKLGQESFGTRCEKMKQRTSGTQRGPFASLGISAADYARKAPQLADSRFSLYTTGFPIHSNFSRASRSTRVAA
jgi:hypothetical protein